LAIVLVAGSLNWAVFGPCISRAEIDRQSLRGM
jgi:hypothetical protein